MLFIPAGSLKFWEGWAYIAAAYVPTILTYLYLYKYDPELFMRRLQRKEKLWEQKLLRRAFTPLTVVGVVIPGLDYRFGWSRDLGGVPLWLALLSQALVLGGVVLVFWAMKVNSFASKTIQVEPEQTVISTGPYGIVRHPFYLGCVMISLFTPLALGSYIALPVWALRHRLLCLAPGQRRKAASPGVARLLRLLPPHPLSACTLCLVTRVAVRRGSAQRPGFRACQNGPKMRVQKVIENTPRFATSTKYLAGV